MTTPPSELDTRTRLDIADVLVRYATGIDRRDWTLFRSCFTDDCVADCRDIGVWHCADEITEWMDRAVGFYDDGLVRTEHGWQIRRRRFTSVFMQAIG